MMQSVFANLNNAAEQLLNRRMANADRQFNISDNIYKQKWQNERRTRAREKIRASRLIHTDQLTGLLNRRGFDTHLDNLYSVAQRLNSEGDIKWTIVVTAYDVDRFRDFNTQFGHDGGDKALKAFASAVQMPLSRATDVAARRSGDEILTAYLCQEKTSERVAAGIANITRAELEDNCAVYIESENMLAGTASIGIAFLTPDIKDDKEAVIAAVIASADAAAYAAKNAGRNCVFLALPNGRIVASPLNPVITERLIVEEPAIGVTPKPPQAKTRRRQAHTPQNV